MKISSRDTAASLVQPAVVGAIVINELEDGRYEVELIDPERGNGRGRAGAAG